MRTIYRITIFFISFLLLFWVYKQNIATALAQEKNSFWQTKIEKIEQDIQIHRSEWAYLNRPDRLRRLVEINAEKLPLVPISGLHFKKIDTMPVLVKEHFHSPTPQQKTAQPAPLTDKDLATEPAPLPERAPELLTVAHAPAEAAR